MLKRILTSIIGLVIFVAIIFTHHYVLYAAVSLLILGMLSEMYNVMDVDKKLRIVGFCTAVILSVAFIIGKMVIGVYAMVMLFMLMLIVLHKKVKSCDVLAVAAVTMFISIGMLSLILIRKKCDQYTVLLPFICAWLTDTGAYFTGTFLGKHKLVPNISPKKTVEGAIGGIILSTIGSVAYIAIMCAVMAKGVPTPLVMTKFAFIGFVGSFVSQAGDLIASCIKRDYDKKDYGSILPGHGGLLDRFDSVIYITPFVYYAMLHIVL